MVHALRQSAADSLMTKSVDLILLLLFFLLSCGNFFVLLFLFSWERGRLLFFIVMVVGSKRDKEVEYTFLPPPI